MLRRAWITALPIYIAAMVLHADDAVVYNRDIRPLLSDRCFACHGPDEAKRDAGLRLDIADGELGPFKDRDGHQVLHPGNPEASELWKRLTTEDTSLRMPPHDSAKKPLSDEQRELIRKWIQQGAKYEDYWSYASLRPQALPALDNKEWLANRIDNFVLAALEKQQLSPQPPADKRTLIRRVTLDLTGLPPTREAVMQFLADETPDAYERLVDGLLSSNQYGEHMARYWLDLVRFADTNGMHHDNYRELSLYRDWVIRAFNANMPFDQFTIHQLAGDLLDNPTVDQKIASGYNRLHMVMDKGTNPPLESYTRNVVDQVSAFGNVFMGMTLECAVCHDHKYDPVKQKDFYQLFAFFNNIDGDPETPGKNQQPPILRLPTEEQSTELNQLDSQLATTKKEIDALKQSLKEASEEATATKTETPSKGASNQKPPDQKSSDKKSQDDKAEQPAEQKPADLAKIEKINSLKEQIKTKEQQLKATQATRDEVERNVSIALVMQERTEVKPAYILKRGAYDQPGDEVTRNTPAFLPPLEASGKLATRLDLARWVTDKRHPLTARVTVNRYWQQFFGVGLVKTSEDFGSQGDFPSHPELLDDLANTFIESNWDVKALVRSIVTSHTYRQSSRVSTAEYLADPENRLLARGSRFRLDSEVIRDQVLHVSDLLNYEMFGKSVKPPQPADLWKTVSMVSSSTYSFKADTGDKIYRRSFYTFWKRAMPPPQMTIFDAPTRESCTSRRERTNTPNQALLLMNESQYFEAAQHLSKQLLEARDKNDEQRLKEAFETITSHLPTSEELADLRDGLNEFRSVYREDIEAAGAMSSELKLETDEQRIELAAMTMVVNSLFNLDASKTRE